MRLRRRHACRNSVRSTAFWLLTAAAVLPGLLRAQTDEHLQHQAWTTADGLPQNSVHAIAQTPDGFLWIATEAGLARFDGFDFKLFSHAELGTTVTDDLCCLAVDGQGVLWIGSSLGVAAIRNSHAVPLPAAAPFTQNAVHQLLRQGDHVVAVTDQGAFALDASGHSEAWKTTALLSAPVSLTDRDGNRWTGSSNGLTLLGRGRHEATRVPALQSQAILSLFEDLEGNIWVGTDTTGLHRLRPSVFAALDGTSGLAVTAVAYAHGAVFAGNRAGELRVVQPSQPVRTLAHLDGAITAIVDAAGTLWVGTSNGLYRVDGSGRAQRLTSEDGLPDDFVRSLAPGAAEDVWVGTAHGLAHVWKGRVDTLTAADGLGGDLLGTLLPLPRRTGIWAATEKGLNRIESNAVVQSLTVPDSIVAGLGYDSHGALWIATQNGVLWREDHGQLHRVLQLPATSARSTVQTMVIDHEDTVWIALRDGVLSAKLSQLAGCTPESCRSLTSRVANWGVADGMPSAESLAGESNPPALDPSGHVFFATRAGVAVASAMRASLVRAVPTAIEKVTLEDTALDRENLGTIPYGRNRLTFEYVGMHLGEPGRVRYRVRLRGFDADWIDAGTRRTATYTSLPPSSYAFDVQATLEGQPWPDAIQTVRFRIAPPFYRRIWFLALALLLLAALILLVYRMRLAAAQRRFALVMAERNRLAREVHDTLAQDLVSTGIQLDVAIFSLGRQTSEQTLELLRTLRRRVAQALDDARESIGELRDPEVRLDLASRLQRLADRRSSEKVLVQTEILGALPALKPGVEMELLRIVSEAVANALRHSAARSVTVRAATIEDVLQLYVTDNGRGFDVAAAETLAGHYGLAGMRERAEAIGATLAVTSTPGDGTTVNVSLRYSR